MNPPQNNPNRPQFSMMPQMPPPPPAFPFIHANNIYDNRFYPQQPFDPAAALPFFYDPVLTHLVHMFRHQLLNTLFLPMNPHHFRHPIYVPGNIQFVRPAAHIIDLTDDLEDDGSSS